MILRIIKTTFSKSSHINCTLNNQQAFTNIVKKFNYHKKYNQAISKKNIDKHPSAKQEEKKTSQMDH